MSREIVRHLTDRLRLQHPVIVLAQLAKRARRSDAHQIVDLAAKYLLVEQRRDAGGKAVFACWPSLGFARPGSVSGWLEIMVFSQVIDDEENWAAYLAGGDDGLFTNDPQG